MAGKQQEQSSVKSGDVLLLYEDSYGGYVYSDITPRLPEYSCVCFYPVKSKEDPGLPDVNCATFSVQLVNEKKSASGTPVHYGQSIKLRHTATGRSLAVSKTTTARCEPNLRVELLEITDSGNTMDDGCQFRIVPLHSDHALGNQVRFNQPVKFESVGVPGHFLHCSSELYHRSLWVVPDRHELNVSSSASALLMILHRSICSTETLGCRAGKLLKLSETKESFSIVAKGFRFRNPLAFNPNPVLDIPDITADCSKSPWHPEDVCAQNKYTDPGKTWFPASLWQFEEERNPTCGELIKFNNHYRIKHVLTKKYLALVTRCRHDLNTCPKILCRDAFKVVLKDRSEIGKSGQEDTYDDTVFTPISPDEQTSTHTVSEGTQMLLRHKKTGMWLNVFHDTVFQWHEIRKKRGGFVFYDLQPYYEVDADKRMLAVAKNPRHAFSVHECCMNPEVLYEVSGILPILTMYIKHTMKSGKKPASVFAPKPLKLEPLKQLLTPESMLQYRAFVAQFGVIELLLTLKGDQLDVAFDLFERFINQASAYEKNRFITVLGTIMETSKKLQVASGIEANAALMLNNMPAWVQDAKRPIKDFLKHVATESEVVLDILGRMCISSGKPVGAIQDAIVHCLLKDSKCRELLYKMDIQDNQVVVYRGKSRDSKQLLSNLKDEELQSLHYQLILFARLCQGGNRLAVQEIVKRYDEDDGFLSFEEAFKCTKNEDGNLQPNLHAAVIRLVRELFAETLESSRDALEPPTWCFEETKETGLTGTLPYRESGPICQLKLWIQGVQTMYIDRNVLLEVVKLLDVLVRKGYITEMEMVQASFKKVLKILQLTSSLKGHVNCEVIFRLIPLFFHLQMRQKVQERFLKESTPVGMEDEEEEDTDVKRLMLQQTTLDAMKVLVDGDTQVPHDLMICYFCWMNLHHGLHEGAEGTTHEAQWLTTNESRSVLHSALQNYSWLRRCLKSFATTDQSKEVETVLKEFADHCIHKGVAYPRNQLIYSSIVLDDILTYIFDPNTTFPMWCWCKICQHGSGDISSSPSVIECFHFLRALAYNNLTVQTRLVKYLDDILPYSEVYPTEVAQLLIEIFSGEPATNRLDIFKTIDNIHLKINEGQIKLLLQVATRKEKRKLPGLPLLKALLFIATYDEADLPITRNQDYVMKNLTVDNSILTSANTLLQPQGFTTWNVEYLLSMTNLLAACAEGKSLSVDAQCQSIFQPVELFFLLCNPQIPPLKKTPFLKFLISVYMDCKGSVRLDISNPVIWQQIWQYLQTVATFLLKVGNDLQLKLQQKPIEDVQEILINVLRPYGIPNSGIDDADGGADFAGDLYYLVKGVLPMLIEFYGPMLQQPTSPTPTSGQIKVTQGICSSLLALGDGLTKVFVSPIHLKMYHVSVAAVVAALPSENIPRYVNLEEVLTKINSDLSNVASKVKKEYDRKHCLEDEESERFKESLKEVLEWDEHDAFQKLLHIFQSENTCSGAQRCTAALGSVLLWLYNEAPLRDWPIYPAIPGLASRCIKALELHVKYLKMRDKELQDRLEKGVYFDQFCEQFSKGECNHLEEVLQLASVSKMEKLAKEALSFLEILLDSHDNPIRKLLAESIQSPETHFPPLSNFLHAVNSCIRDSITASKARIDLREEIDERRGIANSTSKKCEKLQQSETVIANDDAMDNGEAIPLVRFSRPSLSLPSEFMSQLSSHFQSETMGQIKPPILIAYSIEDLIPSIAKLKKMLSIIGLMCDEQNRPLQAHLRKQPGRFDSVNIIGEVVELLHHIHAMHENSQASQSAALRQEAMEIIGLILQALIEFCAGNYENQEVVVNRQISGDITWILSAKEADGECELQSLKAQAVELMETLMEEVAKGSKGLVEKLRDDDKLQESLEIATEEFHSHISVHCTQKRGWRAVLKELCLRFFRHVREPDPLAIDGRSEFCREKVKHARFRAYHFGITLKRKTSAVEDTTKESKASTTEPENYEGKDFCERHSKSIEVFYKHEKKGEPIHTSVSFPYNIADDLREEMKEKIKWSIDRSSPEDKLLDLVRYMKAAREDIEHQKKLRDGLFTEGICLFSGTRHYMLLLLSFFLNLVVLFTFVVPPNRIPSSEVVFPSPIPIGNNSIAISPQTPLWSDVVLYVFGAIHLFLSLWMVIEYYAVTWPHFFSKGWWAAILPRFIWQIVFEIWRSTKQGWKTDELRKYFEPPNNQKLEASLYGWDSIYRLVFLCSSIASLVPASQGYLYCLCLLYIIEESDVLSRVLQAVTKNGKSLLWVGALGIMVLYIYAVISFAFIHESFFVENPEFPLFCASLGQCFVSVIRYGLLDNIGLIVPLVSREFSEVGWRLLYDVSFFIIVTTIGLNIIFGIIVDTFSELRDERWKSEQDMNDRCHICSIANYEFDRLEQDGFKRHVADDHNVWNYIYYYVYVSRVPVRDRTAIQTYVYQAIESGRIDFFPRKYALVLTDRETEATTDDLLKQVKTASHDLAEDITYQAQGTREVVVTRLNKKLALDDSEKDNASKQLEAELQKMKDEIKSMKDGVEKQICTVQLDIARVYDVQQDLANKIAALSSAILERIPVKGVE